MIRKIISSVLILLLAFNIFGFELFFEVILHKYKIEAEEFINRSEFEKNSTIIRVTRSNLFEIIKINDDEIKYKDERYDIFKIERVKDTTYYYCFKDANEEDFINLCFDQNKETKMNNGEKAFNLSLKNLEKLYLFPKQINISSQLKYNDLSVQINKEYIEPIIKIYPQPPKIAAC